MMENSLFVLVAIQTIRIEFIALNVPQYRLTLMSKSEDTKEPQQNVLIRDVNRR